MMPASEAIGSRGAVTGDGRRRRLLVSQRDNRSLLMLFPGDMWYYCCAPFHATFIIKAERAVLETRRAPSQHKEMTHADM
jgi:hypothetical protein